MHKMAEMSEIPPGQETIHYPTRNDVRVLEILVQTTKDTTKENGTYFANGQNIHKLNAKIGLLHNLVSLGESGWNKRDLEVYRATEREIRATITKIKLNTFQAEENPL